MTSHAPPAVLCAGRLYCDLIFTDVPRLPTMGTEVYAGGLGLHAGGGAYITAAHLSALGYATALAAYLPGPPFREMVAGELRAAGLGLDFCRTADPETDPQVTVVVAGGGDRAFLTRRSGPALPPLRAADLAGVGHLHIGELATLVEQPELARIARQAGATVSLDCGWDEGLAASRIAGLLGDVDVFLPNEAEAEHLRSIGVPEPFARLTVIKRGGDGAMAFADGSEVSAPAERVQSVDTTGAGDAFNAGFLSAWLAGRPLSDCLRAGNARGARAIARRGGFHPAPERKAPPAARSEATR